MSTQQRMSLRVRGRGRFQPKRIPCRQPVQARMAAPHSGQGAVVIFYVSAFKTSDLEHCVSGQGDERADAVAIGTVTRVTARRGGSVGRPSCHARRRVIRCHKSKSLGGLTSPKGPDPLPPAWSWRFESAIEFRASSHTTLWIGVCIRLGWIPARLSGRRFLKTRGLSHWPVSDEVQRIHPRPQPAGALGPGLALSPSVRS